MTTTSNCASRGLGPPELEPTAQAAAAERQQARSPRGAVRTAPACCRARLQARAAAAAKMPAAAAALPAPMPGRSLLAPLPGVALALLPKFTCPACWPMWASLFPSLGLGCLLESRWLLPTMVVALLLPLGVLAASARRQRRAGPLAVGLVGAGLVLAGKLAPGGDSLLHTGVPLLVAAALWNAWPTLRAAR